MKSFDVEDRKKETENLEQFLKEGRIMVLKNKGVSILWDLAKEPQFKSLCLKNQMLSYLRIKRKSTPFFYELEISTTEGLNSEDEVMANMMVDTRDGIIGHLWVHPKYRRLGLGSVVLQEAENLCCDLDKIPKVAVNRLAGCVVMFYRKKGYKMTKEKWLGYQVMMKVHG